MLFSFGSRNGGLDLACSLREKLNARPGWGHGAAYVDKEDLQDHRHKT